MKQTNTLTKRPNNFFVMMGDLFDNLGKWFHHIGFSKNPYWFITGRGLDDDDKIYE